MTNPAIGAELGTVPACGTDETNRAIAAATEGSLFVPIARVLDGQLAFVCRNDPVPSAGIVVGLASPTTCRRPLTKTVTQSR